MAYPIATKHHAIELRKKGYSIKEVSKEMGITQSTSSLWLRDINLNPAAQERLRHRRIYGQYITSLIWKQKRESSSLKANIEAQHILTNIIFTPEISLIICASLFWAEGSKNRNSVIFTNSDPEMIKVFLSTFRCAFTLNEYKFRCLVHIHDYHDDKETKKFWSELTGIPLTQFNKSYRKPHTEKRKRPNYPGCIRITYSDTLIAQKLKAIYNTLATKL